MESNTLQHHGTKGQKWGKRLYQNKDGSLTPLGRLRYGSRQSKIAKQRAENLKKARDTKRTKEEEAKALAEKKEKLLKSTNASELYKNRDLLTTAEINERLQRIDTERRLGQVAESTKKTGFDYVDKALKIGKKANEVYEFTNTPVMKSLKKKLGIKEIEKEVKRSTLKELYDKRDKLSDKELSDALKRASTEDAIENILKRRGVIP